MAQSITGDIRRQQLVTESVEQWNSRKRDSSYLLLRGSQLDEIGRWQKSSELILTPLEKEYIAACINQRNAERQEKESLIRRSQVTLVALVVVLTLATIIAGYLAFTAQNNLAQHWKV